MKSDEGKILEATTAELYKIYMHEEYFTLMSFCNFVESCKRQGATIVDEVDNNEKTTK